MNIAYERHPLGNRYLQYAALASVLLLTLIASFYYKGTQSLLLLYGVLTALVVKTILSNRHSYFVFFLFSFLTLGCWGKLVLHLLFDTNFIEPTGAFNGSAESWDKALVALNIAFATLLACSALLMRLPQQRQRPLPSISNAALLMPALYLSIIFTVALLAFNYTYSILKIGTTPTLQLNSYLYVFVSFMIAWGNTILLSTLAYWLVNSGKLKPQALFYLIGFEGALAAVSMGSRAQMILHVAIPFVVYLTQGGKRLGWVITPTQWLKIIVTTLALFVISILLVSADRINSFTKARPVAPVTTEVAAANTIPALEAAAITPPQEPQTAPPKANPTAKAKQEPVDPVVLAQPEPSAPAVPVVIATESAINTVEQATAISTPSVAEVAPAATPASIAPPLALQWKWMFYEFGKLVVDRWVGLEGVLTVISNDDNSWELFKTALAENPIQGTEALYQRMANAQYQAFENFTFMTIPGPIAVLLYSDSYVVLIVGLALVFLSCFLLELSAFHLLENVFTRAAIGVALAYLVVQTNFPRVLFFIFIETLMFAGGLVVLRRLLSANLPTPPQKVTC